MSDHVTPAARSPFDAVLLISFGGPQGLADIRPFLQNVLRGRRVPPGRIEQVARHYERFGGVSPITELTRAQAEGLRLRLESPGPALPVYVGMRNWHPFLADTLAGMADAGVRRALGFILAAHRSWSSCGHYRRNVEDACAEVIGRGGDRIEITYVRDWHDHPGFIAANARHVEDALARLPPAHRTTARIVFTAHSIPLAMAEASRYREQLDTSARLVAEAAGRRDWAVVYQSRSGRPEDAWLEPDVNEYLRREHARGLTAAVLCPIGFVCDHVEVLYDLDHEAAATCRDLGLPMARAAACNDDPLFLDMLADLVRHEVDRYAGTRPLPVTVPA